MGGGNNNNVSAQPPTFVRHRDTLCAVAAKQQQTFLLLHCSRPFGSAYSGPFGSDGAAGGFGANEQPPILLPQYSWPFVLVWAFCLEVGCTQMTQVLGFRWWLAHNCPVAPGLCHRAPCVRIPTPVVEGPNVTL